ncbi:MAG: AmmeMemoRadiSam system protein B [Alphaproteobacteria bacterium]|jgi:hypothetical protein|nr:AmmeMemoRadiSam system protein B [Alphaproteobacteria bacterium]
MTIAVNRVRPAAVAGGFYPAAAAKLARMVDDLIAAAPSYDITPKALIAPHAGYVYSAPIAATAYKSLAGRRDSIRRVVILGPCHRVPVRGFAVPEAQAFATPLGLIQVDQEALARLRGMPGVEISDRAHAEEHALETQLPFLQRSLSEFSIVPVVVGPAPRSAVENLLARLWGGPETLIVISSDLSHYLPYQDACDRDRAACQAIEALEPDRISDDQACGRHSVKGLIGRAQALDLRPTTLDLRNSGDTAGRDQRDRVVGYGAIAFEDAARARLSDSDRAQLLQSAARAILVGLRRGRPPDVAVDSFPRTLRAIRASFVTLKVDGRLRGCVGSVKAHRPLIADVAASTCKAAFGDRRFEPLSAAEIKALEAGMEMSISILSHPRPIGFDSEAEAREMLEPGVDGVILRDDDHNGLFLPQVWDSIPEPPEFLAALKRKAGLAEDHWSEGLRLFRFRCESFGSTLRAR